MAEVSDNLKEFFSDDTNTKVDRDSDDNHSTNGNLNCEFSPENGDKSSSNNPNESEEEGLEYEGELPLEVITTVSKLVQGPILKVKSNGVLTHRNIFTDTERAVLKDIVVNYQDIVDTRSRSRDTFVEKQHAWQRIVIDYNDRPGMAPRTVKELRKCWDNMKYRARQAEKEFQQKSLQEQGYRHMLSFGDISITKDGLSMVNTNGTREIESLLLNDITSDPEMKISSEQEITANVEAAIDSEPCLKKARLDAPKLSRLLLASAWNNATNHLSTDTSQEYTGPLQLTATTTSTTSADQESPSPTEPIVHIKEEPDYNISSSTSTKVKHINLDFNGARSAIDIDALHSNNNGSLFDKMTTFRLGSGMTITSQSTNPPILEQMSKFGNMRPMPTLKKMGVKTKHVEDSKKCKTKKVNNSSSITSSIEPENNLSSLGDIDSSSINSILYRRLLSNRIEQEELEHRLKMKALQKQYHAYSQQSNYWTMKIKDLKSGKENGTLPLWNGEQ